MKTKKEGQIYWGWVKDSLISASDSNTNTAKLSSVKVSYTDENGKKIEDNNNNLDNAEFTKVFQVPNGRIITVTADGCVGGFAILKDTASLGKAADAKDKKATEIFEFSDESLAERKGLKEAREDKIETDGLKKEFFAKLKGKNATKPRATMKIIKDSASLGTAEEVKENTKATDVFEFSQLLVEKKGLKDAMKETIEKGKGLNKEFFAKLKDKNATKPRATMKIEILKDGIA